MWHPKILTLSFPAWSSRLGYLLVNEDGICKESPLALRVSFPSINIMACIRTADLDSKISLHLSWRGVMTF